ncbi:hypothetical protein SEA_BOILGATE_55 [Mycobacterium phage Boilgate]|nr:hypothetical protein SEA_BOILGATE_55 [Mycobacterium phage Boilgate]
MRLTLRFTVFGWQIAAIEADVDTPASPLAAPTPVAGAAKWLSRQWIKGMLA